MSKKLTEEEQLVWDRLLKGIPAPPKYSYLEEEIRKEIDREILADIRNMANLNK